MRLIDADSLIDSLGISDRDIYCKELIEEAPSVVTEPGWISVKDRLPCNGESVLISHSQGVTIAWYNGFYWTHGAASKHRQIKTVKAWMPLPEPPKEETK